MALSLHHIIHMLSVRSATKIASFCTLFFGVLFICWPRLTLAQLRLTPLALFANPLPDDFNQPPQAIDRRIRLNDDGYIDLTLQRLSLDTLQRALDSAAQRAGPRLLLTETQIEALQDQFQRSTDTSRPNPPNVGLVFQTNTNAPTTQRWHRYRHPISAMGTLNYYSGTPLALTGQCTATLIWRDLLLTNAHCIGAPPARYEFRTSCRNRRSRRSPNIDRIVSAVPIANARGNMLDNGPNSGETGYRGSENRGAQLHKDWAIFRLSQPIGDNADCGSIPIARPDQVPESVDHSVLMMARSTLQIQEQAHTNTPPYTQSFILTRSQRVHIQPHCTLFANQAGVNGIRFISCGALMGDSGGPILKLVSTNDLNQRQLAIAGVYVAEDTCYRETPESSTGVTTTFSAPPSRECFEGASVRPSLLSADHGESVLVPHNAGAYYRNIVVANQQFFATWCRLIHDAHPHCQDDSNQELTSGGLTGSQNGQ